MSSPDSATTLFYVLLLILPLSALVAWRLPIGYVAKTALVWIGIFGGLLFVVTLATRQGMTMQSVSEQLGLADQMVTGSTVTLPKSADGHFYATVRIGNARRRLLIDSGATTTMISSAMARDAGIDPSGDPFGTVVQTANGPIIVRRATASRLAIGPIEARDIDVLVSDHMDEDGVVGMNFLSALGSWRVEGDRMILTPRGASGN